MGQATKSAVARVRVGNGLDVEFGESVDGVGFEDAEVEEEFEGGGLHDGVERSDMLILRLTVSKREGLTVLVVLADD